ncbi:transcription antitermination factor NusB [uncultured Mailhella sp.]|uniref:transcription antitermination factor NusB n=1 Tax=uncultured Mailhella sp. TaxID=1981031 RepID=UPI00260C0568|nr:transcription antitermination factor NusB [uncultured Mailhella sp.]
MVEKRKKIPQNDSKKTAREAALEVLHQVFRHPENGTPVPVLLAEKTASLDVRDVSLTSELVYGVLRRFMLLDTVLTSHLRRPAALSPQVRMLLRLGALELLFLDGIPERATVNELVEIARRRFGQRLSSLVNALLRALARDKETVFKPLSLAEGCSLPPWLAELWGRQYGAEKALEFAHNTQTGPAPCWRVNTLRPGSGELLAEWTARGYTRVGDFGFSAFGLPQNRDRAGEERTLLEILERDGALTRQGAASQLLVGDIVRVIREAAFEDVPLWDACCGRGGKSTALLEQGIRVALASDPSAFRLEDFKKSVRRLGLPMPQILCLPVQDVADSFPLILLDVPCSGTGTLGRVPELRLRLTREKLERVVRLQREILESVWPKLEPGGLLFYATCALNKEENETQIQMFLEGHHEAEGVFQKYYFPFFPGQDAMFLSVIRKDGAEAEKFKL